MSFLEHLIHTMLGRDSMENNGKWEGRKQRALTLKNWL
ncbi:hypothetical protein SPSE_1453 [Staphylococcus pseudintermedius ED99]|nr:hypothetical protein SPSE_1453 [Staphylococcus pseudintermedius ED99]